MPQPCQVATSILDLIGNTPVIELPRVVAPDSARLLGKLEAANPGGSLKDRICLAMVEAAERSGALKPGGTIVEPTSGNTGIGLALVAAARGYRLILTMPDTMSQERRSLLRAYGAELVLTPDTMGMHAAIEKAQEILEENPDYFMPGQFSNPANPEAHRHTTAREILEQCPELSAFVAAVGTGGTLTGVGSELKKAHPGLRVVAVEPARSAVLSGGEPGFHGIQGIGAGFVPENLNLSLIDEIITVSDEEATIMARRLAAEEGVLVGISAGAAVHAAAKVAKELGTGHDVLTILCDTGERYLTTGLFESGGI
jgi:cysteine synthase A